LGRVVAAAEATISGVLNDLVELRHVIMPLFAAPCSNVLERHLALKHGIDGWLNVWIWAVQIGATELVQHSVEIFNCRFAVRQLEILSIQEKLVALECFVRCRIEPKHFIFVALPKLLSEKRCCVWARRIVVRVDKPPGCTLWALRQERIEKRSGGSRC